MVMGKYLVPYGHWNTQHSNTLHTKFIILQRHTKLRDNQCNTLCFHEVTFVKKTFEIFL